MEMGCANMAIFGVFGHEISQSTKLCTIEYFYCVASNITLKTLSPPLRKKTIWDIYVKIICEI